MIFLLEDDENIQKLILYTLKSQGFECTAFTMPSEFWKAMNKPEVYKTCDLILLDIMLPQEDGFSVLGKIRSDDKTKSIPVIMVTSKDSEFDIVNGLDAGADDYIAKPFGMMTLVSRIKAVLRRYEKKFDEPLYINAGDISVDLNRHTVLAGNSEVFLTVKEFDLLVLLIKNRGKVISREQLLDSVWNIDADIESRTIDVHIRTLRKKLGIYGNLIETVRGIGYKAI